MITFPNAKINIGLSITSRRADGYHNLSTIMVPVGWSDVLEIVPSSGSSTTLTVYGNKIQCQDEDNLVIRAYRIFSKYVSIPAVDIYLQKIIPDGAGLGGGSADAAFTLTTLNQLFSTGFTTAKLCEMASELGADCPFFIENSPMLATGIGTDLSPIRLPQLKGVSVLIVKPSIKISTAQAYAGVTPSQPAVELIDAISQPIDTWRDTIVNDFEKSLHPYFPLLASIKEQLYESGALYASLSGSGSAVYGLYDSAKLAELAKKSFAEHNTFISAF